MPDNARRNAKNMPRVLFGMLPEDSKRLLGKSLHMIIIQRSDNKIKPTPRTEARGAQVLGTT